MLAVVDIYVLDFVINVGMMPTSVNCVRLC